MQLRACSITNVMAAAPAQTPHQLLTSARACRDPAVTVSVHTPLHMTFQTHAFELGSREIKLKLGEKLGTPSSKRHVSCWINPSHLRSNPTTTITMLCSLQHLAVLDGLLFDFCLCPCVTCRARFQPRRRFLYHSTVQRDLQTERKIIPLPSATKKRGFPNDLNVVKRLGGVLFASS